MAKVHEEPVVVKLSFEYSCKNSVRFNASTLAGQKVVTSLYLMKDAYDLIEQPKVIEVSVRAVQ